MIEKIDERIEFKGFIRHIQKRSGYFTRYSMTFCRYDCVAFILGRSEELLTILHQRMITKVGHHVDSKGKTLKLIKDIMNEREYRVHNIERVLREELPMAFHKARYWNHCCSCFALTNFTNGWSFIRCCGWIKFSCSNKYNSEIYYKGIEICCSSS